MSHLHNRVGTGKVPAGRIVDTYIYLAGLQVTDCLLHCVLLKHIATEHSRAGHH